MSGRTACGYIVAGDVRREAGAFADGFLETVMCASPGPDGEPCGACDGCRRVRGHVHPDVHFLSPEKKSRVISAEAMRSGLLAAVSSTSFCGGWQAGVVKWADCLNEASSNAFLKTLEEPPPDTLFLLLTDKPENLLPTIVSRCQRVDAGRPGAGLSGGDAEPVLAALSADGGDGPLARAAAAVRVCAALETLKERAESEIREETGRLAAESGIETGKDEYDALVSARYREYRRDLLVTMETWYRDIAAVKCGGPDAPLKNAAFRDTIAARAAALSAASCFANVEAVETLAVSFERNLPEAMAVSAAFDRISTGSRAGGAQ